MVEETFIWTEIWTNQEALITFLKGQVACHGSSEYLPTLNENAPLIIAPQQYFFLLTIEVKHFSRATHKIFPQS